MAKRVRGHRANKPNDSFGTINDGSLYRGKYREEVNVDDDEEEVEAQQADTEEATPQAAESFVESAKEPEHDYKKRYDDLKKHYDAKVEEFKSEISSLKTAVSERKVDMPRGVEAPKTLEELEAFKKKYPDVFEVVQTVSMMQSESQLSELREELGTIKEREKNLEKQNAYQELLGYHPDFDDLKQEEKFISWLEEQPASIADGIYKNNTDAKLAARVIDLYKADIGQTKKKSSKSASAAESVKKPAAREVATTGKDGRIWKASEIGKMKPWEFEKLEAELDTARSEGRIDYNS